MPTARKASTPKSEDYSDTVKDVTIDVLVRRAFPYGQWANALDWLDQQSLAPEVAAEIRSAIERNR